MTAGGYIHLDGDKKNFTPENLFYVTTEELRVFYRKKYERMSAEQMKARLLAIRLDLKIKELESLKVRSDEGG